MILESAVKVSVFQKVFVCVSEYELFIFLCLVMFSFPMNVNIA